jgi:hypothetical protein
LRRAGDAAPLCFVTVIGLCVPVAVGIGDAEKWALSNWGDAALDCFVRVTGLCVPDGAGDAAFTACGFAAIGATEAEINAIASAN